MQTDDDEVEIDCQLYTLGYRVIDGDVGLPHNSFTTSDFMPHGESLIYACILIEEQCHYVIL